MPTYVIVENHVRDYDQWLPVFKGNVEVRREHGAQGHTVSRGVEDPNHVVIVNEFATTEGARAFASDPRLKAAMEKAGVEGMPTIHIVEEADSARY